MFLSIGMLKLNYFLADIFILSAEKQPIKLSWRKIECLLIMLINRPYTYILLAVWLICTTGVAIYFRDIQLKA